MAAMKSVTESSSASAVSSSSALPSDSSAPSEAESEETLPQPASTPTKTKVKATKKHKKSTPKKTTKKATPNKKKAKQSSPSKDDANAGKKPECAPTLVLTDPVTTEHAVAPPEMEIGMQFLSVLFCGICHVANSCIICVSGIRHELPFVPAGEKSSPSGDSKTDGEGRQTWEFNDYNCFVVAAAEVIFHLQECGHLPTLAGRRNSDSLREKIRIMWMKVCEKRREGDWIASNKFFDFLCVLMRECMGLKKGSKGCCEEAVDIFMSLYIGNHQFTIVRTVKHGRVCFCWRCCQDRATFKITRGMLLRSVLMRTRICYFYLAHHEEASAYVAKQNCRAEYGEVACLGDSGTSFIEELGQFCSYELSVVGDLPDVLFLRRDPSDLVVNDTIQRQKPFFKVNETVEILGFNYKLVGAILYISTYALDDHFRVQRDHSGAYVKAYSHYKSMSVIGDKYVVKDCYGKPEQLTCLQFEDQESQFVSLLIYVKI